jgi:hypothetical protein
MRLRWLLILAVLLIGAAVAFDGAAILQQRAELIFWWMAPTP